VKIANIVLLPLAWLYGGVVMVRNLFFDTGIFWTKSVSVPVISVGNLTVGGTGKTPIVEYIVGVFLSHGISVAVVSRGYGRVTRGTVVVSDGNKVLVPADEAGDEPFQLARKFPSAAVVVDERRTRGARFAVDRLGAEAIVLDDGFQHRWLKRDLDMLVIDIEHPPYATHLLPAGRRRELLRGAKRAQAVVYSRWSDQYGTSVSQKMNIRVPEFRAQFIVSAVVNLTSGRKESVEVLKGRPCVAFCGIARPDSFRRILIESGIVVKEFLTFRDHHRYSENDLMDIAERCKSLGLRMVVTTEKDAARLSNEVEQRLLSSVSLYYIELATKVMEEENFEKLLLKTTRH
jgi:tetraacyldisaccharide 4'-kinase